jgi:hypothetical protein
MAYMQKPGRGNHPKTGHGLPSAFHQEVELTKKYNEGVETYTDQRNKGNTPSGMSVDSKTGKATANLPMHTTRKQGSYLTELDSKGHFVSHVNVDANPSLAESFEKKVKNRNEDVTRSQTNNADFYNANSGGTSPSNLSNKQKASLEGLGKIKKSRG